MSLLVDVRITNGRGGTDRIEGFEIRRLEPLDHSDDHADEVHPYQVRPFTDAGRHPSGPTIIHHRYGDGHRALVALAMGVLAHPPRTEGEKPHG